MVRDFTELAQPVPEDGALVEVVLLDATNELAAFLVAYDLVAADRSCSAKLSKTHRQAIC